MHQIAFSSNTRLVLSTNKKWYNNVKTSRLLTTSNKQLLSSSSSIASTSSLLSSICSSNQQRHQRFHHSYRNDTIYAFRSTPLLNSLSNPTFNHGHTMNIRNYHQWTNNNSVVSNLTSIPLLLSKIPKGFENFYPKDKTSDQKTKNKNKSKKESNFKGSGNNNGPEHESSIAGTILLSMIAYTIYQLLNETSTKKKNGSEITWSDFRNHLLENDLVSKIVVINKKIARVYLHPNVHNKDLIALSSSSSGSNNDLSIINQVIDDDDTTMEMNISSSETQQLSTNDNEEQRQQQSEVFHFHIGSVESFEEKLRVAQKELNFLPRDYIPVQYVNETNYVTEIIKSLPMLVGIGAIFYFTRRFQNMNPKGGGSSSGGGGGMGNIFHVGKSNAKKIKKEDVNVDFSHVAGCQEAKKEIMEFVDFLQDSTLFTKLGAKIPKGALLCGPPGTGKTLLAKAVAGEANVPFYSISGSDFVEMFVGVGPSRVRDLFKEARANAPCIVFIDEIDAVGRKRRQGGFSGGNDERENTLNQLLVEMDGFNTSTAVVVLAGTNRIDILDNALTRPGRFDRTITVDLPDIQGRRDIFKVHLKGITLGETEDNIANRLAGLTPGFSGADIANLCNEAAIVGARRNADSVSVEDFEKATDRIIGGLESHKIMSKEEREIVAHHEAGHAVAGWFLEHADPLLKLTIIPRSSGALGFAQYLPKEVSLRTEAQIMDIVCMALAGRASEEIFFGKVTTGAVDDLRRVTSMIYNNIKIYGMNNRLGQLAFPSNNNSSPFGGDSKPYSDATAQAMDEEAKRLVTVAYNRALSLLREKKTEVEKVTQMLLEKETITHDDVYDLIGPRPFEMDKSYAEFISRKKYDDNSEEKNVQIDGEEQSGSAKDDADVDQNNNNGPTLTPGLV